MPDEEQESGTEDVYELRLKELEEKAAELRRRHAASANIDEEMDRKMSDIHERANRLKEAQEQKRVQAERQTRVDAEANKGLGLGFAVAYTIIGVPLLGALVGYLIDRSRGTNLWTGLCTRPLGWAPGWRQISRRQGEAPCWWF